MSKDMWIYIGIGVVAALVLAMWLILSPSCEVPESPSDQMYYYGKAELEGSDLEDVKDKAVNIARAEMVEKISVSVSVIGELERYSAALCRNGRCSKEELENFRKKIFTQASMEISGYRTKISTCKLGGKYRVIAIVYIDKPTAENYVKVLSLHQILKSSIETKMLFHAKNVLDEIKKVLPFLLKRPSALSDLEELEAKIKEALNKANGYIVKLRKMNVNDVDDALKFLSVYKALTSITVDFPEDVENKKNVVVSNLKSVLRIEGPRRVLRTQKVKLNIEILGAKGSYTLDVESKGMKLPGSVTVKNGHGTLEGYITGDDVKVAVSLTDLLKKEWSPGASLPPTVENAIDILLSRVKVPSERVVFLPWGTDPENIMAAMISESIAEKYGWNVARIEKLVEIFDEITSDWTRSYKIEKIPAVYVKSSENGLEFSGVVKDRISAKLELERASEEDVEKVLKAAVVSGHPEFAKESGGFISAVAYYIDGDLENAKRILESLSSEISVLALSRVYYDLGDYANAIEKAAKVLKDYPIQSSFIIAMSLAKLPAEMIILKPEYQQYIYYATQLKDNHAAYYAASVLTRKLGNCEESRIWIEKALGIFKDPRYELEYAKVLICLNEKERAVGILKKILENSRVEPSLKREAESLLEKLEK
jgi:tetratricopeptide (TPR) repeat protein